MANTTNLEQLFEEDGTYTITLVASEFNEQCTDTITKTIYLERENYLYIPSSFGNEMALTLFSSGYVNLEFKLLNSLGQVVVRLLSTPIANGELSLLGNKTLARGIYFYEIKATKENGELVELSGKVVRM